MVLEAKKGLSFFSVCRVASRYSERVAREFPSEEALREYLHEHPGADPANHSVKKAPEKSLPEEGKPSTLQSNIEAFTGKTLDQDPEHVAKHMEKVFGRSLPASHFEDLLSGAGLKATLGDARVKREAFTMSFDLHDETGAKAGRVFRHFQRNRKNELVAYHQVLYLNEDQQGKGYGKAMLKKSLSEYEKMGVDRIEVHAVDKGAYVWAALGYKIDDPEVESKWNKWAAKNGIPERAARTMFEDQIDTPGGIAALHVNGRHVGKEFLMTLSEDGWDGSLPIKKGDAHYEYMKKRVEG